MLFGDVSKKKIAPVGVNVTGTDPRRDKAFAQSAAHHHPIEPRGKGSGHASSRQNLELVNNDLVSG